MLTHLGTLGTLTHLVLHGGKSMTTEVTPDELRGASTTIYAYSDRVSEAKASPSPDGAADAMPNSPVAAAAGGLGLCIEKAVMTVSGHLQQTGNLLTDAANTYDDSDAAAARSIAAAGALNTAPPEAG